MRDCPYGKEECHADCWAFDDENGKCLVHVKAHKVTLVRCQACRHYSGGTGGGVCMHPRLAMRKVEPMDYCSWASERGKE